MNRIAIAIILASGLGTMCTSAAADRQDDHAAALALIQRTTASQLEAGLPSQPITEWLVRIFGAAVKWDMLPGCGDPNHQHDDRLCVVTTIPFNGDLEATVTIDVGRVSKIEGPAKLDLAYVERSDGSHFNIVKRLSDFPKLVSATKK
jgi:hypothetical protein